MIPMNVKVICRTDQDLSALEQLTPRRDVRWNFGEPEEPREASLALTDRVEGVTIRGSKYDVEGVEVTNAFPLGVGNDFKTDISLAFRSGVAAVLLCDRGE